jgi:hypothetical protein
MKRTADQEVIVRLRADLAAALATVERQRRRFRDVERELLAHAAEIGSASQARRIIFSIFHRAEKEP